MTDVYTPTTKNIRDCYLYADEQFDGTLRTPANIANAEFDRWLDSHDAEVKAELVKENETLREELQDMSGDFYAMARQHE